MKNIPTILVAELSNPHKIISKFGERPVAISNGQEVVGYFVPNHALHELSVVEASDSQLIDFLDNKLINLNKNLDYLKKR
jgi:hypothetical protein